MSNWIRAANSGQWHRYRASDNSDPWNDGITCACGDYITTSGDWIEPGEWKPDRDIHSVCLSISAREAHWQGELEGVEPEAIPSRTSDLAHQLAPGLGAVVVSLYPSATSGLPQQHVALRAEDLYSDIFGAGETFAEAAGEILAALERVRRTAPIGHVTLRDAD